MVSVPALLHAHAIWGLFISRPLIADEMSGSDSKLVWINKNASFLLVNEGSSLTLNARELEMFWIWISLSVNVAECTPSVKIDLGYLSLSCPGPSVLLPFLPRFCFFVYWYTTFAPSLSLEQNILGKMLPHFWPGQNKENTKRCYSKRVYAKDVMTETTPHPGFDSENKIVTIEWYKMMGHHTHYSSMDMINMATKLCHLIKKASFYRCPR